jgi:hypothetical protein
VHGKAVELQVLQYGATRKRLTDALLERAGWDVVHLSGHGRAGGLVLEDDAGRPDEITSAELVGLLDLGSEQIKLVTLSACESAAVTATEHLRLLGLAPTRDGDPADAEPQAAVLPAVAAEVVDRLDPPPHHRTANALPASTAGRPGRRRRICCAGTATPERPAAAPVAHAR